MEEKGVIPISIIIPTYNEGEYLPRTLKAIKNQTVQPLEVIVSDGGSKDNTKEVAESLGAIFLQGSYKAPSGARNGGARIAQGEILYFLDADVNPRKDFLEKSYNEFINSEINGIILGTAVLDNEPCYKEGEKGYSSKSIRFIDDQIYAFHNLGQRISARQFPTATATCIITKKEVFDKVGGFREDIEILEDSNYALRASEVAPFGVLNSTPIYVSTRRFDKYKQRLWFPLCMGLLGSIGRMYFGEVDFPVGYFGGGNFKPSKVVKKWMIKKYLNPLEEALLEIYKKTRILLKNKFQIKK